jgi:hypothetical protein
MEVSCERAMLAELMEVPEEEEEQTQNSSSSSSSDTAEGAAAATATSAMAGADATAASNGSSKVDASATAAVAAEGEKASKSSSKSSSRLLRMPDFAIACNSKFNPAEGEMCLKAMVSSEDGQVMLKVTESAGAARVYDAVELGKKVGKQLRAFAEEQGWYPEEVRYEEEEKEAVVATA